MTEKNWVKLTVVIIINGEITMVFFGLELLVKKVQLVLMPQLIDLEIIIIAIRGLLLALGIRALITTSDDE